MMTISLIFHGKPRRAAANFSLDTSELDWRDSTIAMIVLLWSRATRDLLKSFAWGIAALHQLGNLCKSHLPVIVI